MRVILIAALALFSNFGWASTRTILSCQTMDIETPMDIVQSGNYLKLSLRGLEKGGSTTGDSLISFFNIKTSTGDWLGPYDIIFKFPSEPGAQSPCTFSTGSASPPTFSCSASPTLSVSFVAELEGSVLVDEQSSLVSATMSEKEDGTYGLVLNLADPSNPGKAFAVGGDTDDSLDYSPGSCAYSH